ncbi:hypothetical protein [Streptomyces sp. NBC_00299]|uniref:hypothetical protein n=1 Tax=Streptomyces sp. NBC_00299 TaxID=2975705 RepID=UPI002E2C1612|nr:hypothetical protein [Streptomyces sp. NBC_00299]
MQSGHDPRQNSAAMNHGPLYHPGNVLGPALPRLFLTGGEDRIAASLHGRRSGRYRLPQSWHRRAISEARGGSKRSLLGVLMGQEVFLSDQ